MESDMPEVRQAPPDEKQVGTQKLSKALTAEERAAKRTQMLIVGGAVGLLAIFVAAIVLMASHSEATETIRDIAIVMVAVETFLIGLAMILLIFQIQVLIQVLRDEIQPLLHSVNDTASTVRGTTEFVSHNMVTPIIKLAGFSSGVRQVLSNVLGIAKATRRHSVAHADTDVKGGKSDVQPG